MALIIRTRDRVALNLPPLLLRLMLGAIFLWAGLMKVSQTMEFSGDAAASLANMGVLGSAPAATPPATPETKPAEVKPPAATPPESKPPEAPKPEATPPAAPKPETTPAAPKGAGLLMVRYQAKQYTAADFPAPVRVRMLYALALALQGAAHPPAGQMHLWPEALATGSWPVYQAWAVAITELAGGLCLLLGILTRLASFGLVVVMAGALWLTQIGPALQAGKTQLGFLPDYPVFDPMKWQEFMVQFALGMAALALMFLGPGRLSLDSALLSSRGEDDDDE